MHIVIMAWLFVIGTMALAGALPLSGLYSKDEILHLTLGHSKPLVVIGVLTSTSVVGGVAFFAFAGVAPVAFYAWIKLRQLDARRRAAASAAGPASVRQQRVDGGDDADTGRDQQ